MNNNNLHAQSESCKTVNYNWTIDDLIYIRKSRGLYYSFLDWKIYDLICIQLEPFYSAVLAPEGRGLSFDVRVMHDIACSSPNE